MDMKRTIIIILNLSLLLGYIGYLEASVILACVSTLITLISAVRGEL